MLILAIESSAVMAGAAILDGGALISEASVQTKLANITHSATLMTLVEAVLRAADVTIKDIGGVAVSAGSGSFTGVRIGVSLAKGLAFADNIPVAAVSSLAALCENYAANDAVTCAVMDARRGQFYNRLSGSDEDRVIPAGELACELALLGGKIVLVGDGAEKAFDLMSDDETHGDFIRTHCVLPRENIRNASAFSVGRIADSNRHLFVSAENVRPIYLRLPQAERERLLKAENSNN